MKKKLIVLAALVTIVATSAMANTEIDLNYYITPVISRSISVKDFGKATAVVPSFVGLEGNFNFMFGSNAGVFDMGLNMDLGIHAITGKVKIDTFDNDGKKIDTGGFIRLPTDTPFGGTGTFLSLAPIFRFTFANIHSISLAPGLQVGFDFGATQNEETGSYTAFIDFNIAASLNAAYKLWFINRSGFHMGLNIGADVDFPFAGLFSVGWWSKDEIPSKDNWTTTGDTLFFPDRTLDYAGGVNFRIFLGLAFQFGDRAYDRQFNYYE